MKNLIPHFTIVIIGIIGAFVWGVWGFLGGLVVGYIITLLFGLSLIKISGGILPRKVRKETARNFLDLNLPWLRQRIPLQFRGNELPYIENLLEKIAKKAAIVGPATASGMSYGEFELAVESIAAEEKNSNVIEIVEKLWEFIKHTWYSTSV